MSFSNPDNAPFSSQEFREWIRRYSKVRDVIKSLDDDYINEINEDIMNVLSDYFGDFPGIQEVLDGKQADKSVMPIVIFVTEDVLRDRGIYVD